MFEKCSTCFERLFESVGCSEQILMGHTWGCSSWYGDPEATFIVNAVLSGAIFRKGRLAIYDEVSVDGILDGLMMIRTLGV